MGRSVNKIAKKALDEAKALVLPKINEKLRDELPMAVRFLPRFSPFFPRLVPIFPCFLDR